MVENEYSRGKVDNEYDFCAITDKDVKSQLEKIFMKRRVSYFLRWEKPGFFAKLLSGAKERIVFCINSADLDRAEEAVRELELSNEQISLLRTKSNNRQGY